MLGYGHFPLSTSVLLISMSLLFGYPLTFVWFSPTILSLLFHPHCTIGFLFSRSIVILTPLSFVAMNSNGSAPTIFLAHYVLSSSVSSQFLTSILTLNKDLLNLALSPEFEPSNRLGGLTPGKGANLPWDAEAGHSLVFHDYFAESPVNPERLFRRRFRMSRSLFLHIMDTLGYNDVYFTQRSDALSQSIPWK